MSWLGAGLSLKSARHLRSTRVLFVLIWENVQKQYGGFWIFHYLPLGQPALLLAFAAWVVTDVTEQDEVSNADS